MQEQTKGKELFIVDNSDTDWKVRHYLSQWCELSKSFDIATGYFEIGALLNLDGKWQGLEKIRILMGDEVSKRTMKAFEQALYSVTKKLDESLETEKKTNDFLDGVPAIVQAIKSGKIECRVFRKKKFHAKAYITHSKFEVVGSVALVGSSNFTEPGLNQNVELNIQVKSKVEELQEWFERHWNEAEDVTPEVLKTIERHTRDFLPFEIYVKSLYEYFKGHELSESEWELNESKVYQILSQYQREGYQALMKIASKYNGAFLCDGVGLGKTFIGLMLIERLLLRENKRVVLIVPKSARKAVWEAKLKKYIPEIMKGSSGGLVSFKIINHTDLLRVESGEVDWPGMMEGIRDHADVIIIDEAHNFRNRTRRYWKLFEICNDKQMYFLTATPINNSLLDLLHQMDLFTREDPEYFSDAPLGIHSLRGHFIKLENAILASIASEGGPDAIGITDVEAQEILANDELLKTLIVQRSRAYVKESQQASEVGDVVFPQRKPPLVINYSLTKVYGKLLDVLIEAFDAKEPLLTLTMYYPLKFYTGQQEGKEFKFEEGRQKQVVGLIRTLLLKRFESSKQAFEYSCEDLLLKLIAFVRIHNPEVCLRWERQNKGVLDYISEDMKEREKIESGDEEDDYMPQELLSNVEKLDKKEYEVASIVNETLLDMNVLSKFIQELIYIKGREDDKIDNLITNLTRDDILKNHKIIVFTEYMHTARYIYKKLVEHPRFKDTAIEEIDGASKRDRGDVIKCFSPYYNDSSSTELKDEGLKEIQILISTDVLSEGLNLQDGTLLINYDLHWNPVRLMQRIGRIDRRFDTEIEEQIISDHPHLKDIRGIVHLWNFLPPEELNDVLSLYERVTHKTLRISKTFGIEGKKLLTPEDDYEALKEFNQGYEGKTTMLENMHIEYQKIVEEHPDMVEIIKNIPSKSFTGKPSGKDVKAVFFCYNLPGPDADGNWTEEAGQTKWYLNTMGKDPEIIEDPTKIIEFIRCDLKTARKTELSRDDLITIRGKVDYHVKNTYLKSVQAPGGVTVTLKAWMELN